MKGSIPPIPAWYSCIREMRGQPFDQQKVDGCLHSVLSRPHLTAGRVIVKHHRRFAEVTFFLESPALVLSKVDFGLSVDRQMEFENLLRLDEFALHSGDTFDTRKETQTAIKLRQFLKSKGVLALVSNELLLDYVHKTASLIYKVWEGPDIAPEYLLLP